jgi:radial spoke head protein 4A
MDEETQDIKMAEEPPQPSTEELKSLEAWSHFNPNILKVGRCSHIPVVGPEGEPLEEPADDKVEERFKTINEDTPVPSSETAWVSKVCGDTQQYNKGEGTVTYAVNVLRSLRWPGAVTVAKSGKYSNIYVGDGIKKGDTAFNPIEPPEVQSDPIDYIEMPEPTPLVAPEEPAEPDTDKEDKPEGEEEDA